MDRGSGHIGTILLVEDYEDVRSMLKILLESEHYRVLAAATGFEALSIIKRERPDLILMDLGLPEFDGLETIRSIRKIDGFQNTPVIVLSAYSRHVFYKSVLRAGGNYFIGKPIDFDNLAELLRRVLEDSDGRTPEYIRSSARRAVASNKPSPSQPRSGEVRWSGRFT